jgi:hypothetical protein
MGDQLNIGGSLSHSPVTKLGIPLGQEEMIRVEEEHKSPDPSGSVLLLSPVQLRAHPKKPRHPSFTTLYFRPPAPLAFVIDMATTNGTAANGNHRKDVVDVSVALRPNNPESVPGLIQDISATGHALNSDDGASRLRLLEKARDLVRALETPRETMIKHCWAQVSIMPAVDISVYRVLMLRVPAILPHGALHRRRYRLVPPHGKRW